MDNKALAGILFETADLLEIDGQDSFRIRSYRNAAEAIEANPQQISDLISDPKQVLAIAGIGKGMLTNLQEMLKEGTARDSYTDAGEVSAVDAGAFENSGTGAKDDCADLERL